MVRIASAGGVETVTYTHTDHLGSPVASTNASGTLLWREDYTPFGEARQRPAANDNDEGYTGHIADSDTGIVYMQARYYDPAIGRFLSQDPVGFAEGGPAFLNRYAYVGNDPLNATDPGGEAGRPNRGFGSDPLYYSDGPGGISGRARNGGVNSQNVGDRYNRGNRGGDVNSGAFDEPITELAERTAQVSTTLALGGGGTALLSTAIVGTIARGAATNGAAAAVIQTAGDLAVTGSANAQNTAIAAGGGAFGGALVGSVPRGGAPAAENIAKVLLGTASGLATAPLVDPSGTGGSDLLLSAVAGGLGGASNTAGAFATTASTTLGVIESCIGEQGC